MGEGDEVGHRVAWLLMIVKTTLLEDMRARLLTGPRRKGVGGTPNFIKNPPISNFFHE